VESCANLTITLQCLSLVLELQSRSLSGRVGC